MDVGDTQVRAGSRALSIFTYALNARILRAHAAGSAQAGELAAELGWAPHSTLRVSIESLIELGAIARVGPDESTQNGAATELTEAGRDLLEVADALEHWLALGPVGPVSLDDPAARGTVRVLTAAWDSAMIRVLAERPVTLGDLNATISHLSYPALKRRLAKLRSTHLAESVKVGRVTAYTAADWLRRSIVPLAIAGRWELEHDPGARPISADEVEAAFLLTLPLVELSSKLSGNCNLTVLTSASGNQKSRDVAGVWLQIDEGRLVALSPDTTPQPSTWALGTPAAWIAAVIDGDYSGLRIAGANRALPRQFVEGIHFALQPERSVEGHTRKSVKR